MATLSEVVDQFEQEGWKAPPRPQQVFTWETRLEPQLAAEMLQWFQKNGILVRSKSELLRLSLMLVRDIFVAIEAIKPISDLPTAMEMLEAGGIMQQDSLRTMSKRGRMMGVISNLQEEQGFSNVLGGRKFSRDESKAPLFPSAPMNDEEIKKSIDLDIFLEELGKDVKASSPAVDLKPRTPEEQEQLARTIALRRRFKTGIKVPEVDDVITAEFFANNEWRRQHDKEPLIMGVYAIALKKGMDVRDVDQERDFPEFFEFINPQQAALYCNPDSETDAPAPTKAEMLRAIALENERRSVENIQQPMQAPLAEQE